MNKTELLEYAATAEDGKIPYYKLVEDPDKGIDNIIDHIVSMHKELGYSKIRLLALSNKGNTAADKFDSITTPKGDKIRKQDSYDKLHNFVSTYISNDYGVFIPHNPFKDITYRYDGTPIYKPQLSKENVASINHIVIESDDASLELQYELFESLKRYVRYAIYSGNKSIHLWLYVGNLTVDCKKYHSIIDTILKYTELNGIKVDPTVLKDISKKVRIPEYPNGKGVLSKLIYHNDNPVIFEPEYQFYIESYKNRNTKPTSLNQEICSEGSDTIECTFCKDLDENELKTEEEIRRFATYKNSIPNFFTNLDSYYDYMENGVPNSGYRTSMYRDVIIANRILQGYDAQQPFFNLESTEQCSEGSDTIECTFWTKERLFEVCKRDVEQILELSEGRYGCGYDWALEDFERFYNKSILMKIPIKLPNILSWYQSIEYNEKSLRTHMQVHSMPSSIHCARILKNVILPKIKELPFQAKRGILNIHRNNDIVPHVNGRYVTKALKALYGVNILRRTFKGFSGCTSSYWVNIPLVLYLTVKEPKLLDWENPYLEEYVKHIKQMEKNNE